ncbi:hypothetical protein [Amycolatopsis taiwanensis]|uniref:Uncharacterized protein n=1 Tax=Amycolatopsis taiwanensis TaxID=342230 RepID=A0A9W6QU86_9PSEU|nr:hypothetical protein Atai01_07550 [Amycolatopsis taiwanensis]
MEFVDSIPVTRTGHLRPVPGREAMARSAARSSMPAITDPRAAQVRRYESGQLVWRVQCGDMINRERCVTVLVQDNQVVLVGPPGETARLTAGQLGQLRAALNEAAKLTER